MKAGERLVGAVPGDWAEDTPCKGKSHLFFAPANEQPGPAQTERIRQAKALCASCPTRSDCREFAMETGEPAGVWGSLTPGERRALSYERGLVVPCG